MIGVEDEALFTTQLLTFLVILKFDSFPSPCFPFHLPRCLSLLCSFSSSALSGVVFSLCSTLFHLLNFFTSLIWEAYTILMATVVSQHY